jgi:hypothetical protein
MLRRTFLLLALHYHVSLVCRDNVYLQRGHLSESDRAGLHACGVYVWLQIQDGTGMGCECNVMFDVKHSILMSVVCTVKQRGWQL